MRETLFTALAACAGLAGPGPGPAAAAATTATTATALCNGHAELCGRRYSNVTFVGSHDSPFVGATAADNQEVAVADQLALGVRFLQAQTHAAPAGGTAAVVVELCHTLCILADAGPLASYLATVRAFLDGNPGEVVTLLLTNQDGLPGAAFDAAFASSGARAYAFAPAGNLTVDRWPTLGQMIAAGQRLVVFMDFPAGPPVPYILNEFQPHIFETPYDTTDPTFAQCAIDRPSGASPAGRMILVNHFLDTNLSGILIPNRNAANVTNSATSIMAQAGLCSNLYQRTPNFILLDWISIGDAMLVQAMMNGVTYVPSPPMIGQTGNSTSGSSGNGDGAGAATGTGKGTGTGTDTGTQQSTPESTSVSAPNVGGRSDKSSQLAAMVAFVALLL